MTYSEHVNRAVENTGYTVDELITLALACAEHHCKKWQDETLEAGAFKAYQHYETLLNAFGLMKQEHITNGDIPPQGR